MARKAVESRVRWQLCMGAEDFSALDVIRRVHGQNNLSEAARFALHEQERHTRNKNVADGGLLKVMVRRWQIWMDEADFLALDQIRRGGGHESTAGAMRYAIRQQAERDLQLELTNQLKKR